MSGTRHFSQWMLVASATLVALPCHAQGNIDAGKSPAQIFNETCAVCHRDGRQIRRASVTYLRQHYTSSYEEANAMAAYVARLASEPRPAQPKNAPAAATAAPADAAKQQPRQQPSAADQAKSAQGQPKGRRAAVTAEGRSLPPGAEENLSPPQPTEEPTAPPPPAAGGASPSPVAARPAPTLVPFQE